MSLPWERTGHVPEPVKHITRYEKVLEEVAFHPILGKYRDDNQVPALFSSLPSLPWGRLHCRRCARSRSWICEGLIQCPIQDGAFQWHWAVCWIVCFSGRSAATLLFYFPLTDCPLPPPPPRSAQVVRWQLQLQLQRQIEHG